MADLRKFRARESQKIECKSKEMKMERIVLSKTWNGGKSGHLLRLEERMRQTAQTGEGRRTSASQTRANEDRTRKGNG